MKSIEKKELEKLIELNQNYRSLQIRICDIEITKERLKNEKITSMANVEIASHDLSSYQHELAEKYGSIDIDLKTGEYKLQK